MLGSELSRAPGKDEVFKPLIKKEILDNGLTLITEAMPQVRSVAVGISLRRGSRHERDEESGISHFIEHMVFKGTSRRSQVQIAREMDAIGGQADAFTTKEYASFYAKVLDEHLPVVMDIFADILLHPSFDPAEFERERNVIIEEIKMVEDTHDELAHEIFVESFWPNHPLGRSILGTRSTVESFDRDDLVRFFKNTYTPDNLIVAAAGNLTHENVVELTRKYFDSLEPRPNRSTESPPRVETAIRCREKDLEQVHLVMGTVAPPHTHVDRYASYVLNTVLGGTMSSRLFQVIRETKGLAYSVFSGLTSYRDAGNLTVYAGMSPQNVSQVVDLVLDELRRIRHEPVTDEELRRAKDHIKGSIMLGLEGTGSRMSQLARHEMYFGRHISMDELLDRIERVTHEEVLRLAAEMLEGRSLGLSAVGNLDNFNPVHEKLVA
jgi:predicted Zn-dependent peptidase